MCGLSALQPQIAYDERCGAACVQRHRHMGTWGSAVHTAMRVAVPGMLVFKDAASSSAAAPRTLAAVLHRGFEHAGMTNQT